MAGTRSIASLQEGIHILYTLYKTCENLLNGKRNIVLLHAITLNFIE